MSGWLGQGVWKIGCCFKGGLVPSLSRAPPNFILSFSSEPLPPVHTPVTQEKGVTSVSLERSVITEYVPELCSVRGQTRSS